MPDRHANQPDKRGFWGRLTGAAPMPVPAAPNPAETGFQSLFGAPLAPRDDVARGPAPLSLGSVEMPSKPPPIKAAPVTKAAPAAAQVARPAPPRRVLPSAYLAPRDLERSAGPPVRALAIGSCFLESLLGTLNGGDNTKVDLVLATGVQQFPEHPPADIASYDYQVVQIPLRDVMHDNAVTQLAYADLAGHQAAFARACRLLALQVNSKLAWNAQHGLLTFVFNFMTPQFAAMGRFVPRFDLRNPAFFVRQLNQELETLVGGFRNAHIFDLDALAASFGRRYVQDDVFTNFGHNATLGTELPKLDRLEKVPPLGDFLDIEPGRHFKAAIASELRAMLRSVRQIDAIKLVVVDLDDTLWNGVSGDTAEAGPHMIEGWPIGFAEVLLYLRKRGVLLAIASKNDEARIHAIWRPIFGGRLKLEDFAAVRINWRPKIENMAEILSAMNLLPRNVLFIDDNPVERAAMQAAFPEIRLLGSNPYELRRILFNAAELQGVSITQESAARTEMIQAQMQRETERAALSPDDFAREQNTTVKLSFLTSVDHSRFPRALELINKTNQFNTTGRRWKAEECAAFFKAKGVFAVFDVEDRFTPYGLVGVVILAGGAMLQWVMSCRVIGMRVEQAVMAALVAQLRAGGQTEITGILLKNDINQPCQSLFPDAGFVHADKIWQLPPDRKPAAPAYVRLETAVPVPIPAA